ncbi:hypothetical protein CYMTET_38075 [Cymbomonas tetramitiformis]|uniref:Uncharacterized protein n=1 Tax=Cymbomonas tetramitiformis TaxID=36881 RepID=A0AAE0F5K2_9CHLO|nr:hypothetical protein CYMTET_38075 [Cymbomonas tetramitiformis]
MAAMKATHSMTRTQRVEKEYAAMTSALVKHVPSANAPVNTFAIAYAVIPLSYPDYPIGADGHPLRLGLKTDLHIDRVYDQYGLPRCCMTHRIDPAKWKGEVVDLASEEESEPDETAEDDNSSNRRIRYSSPDLPYSSPTGGDCRSYMARNLAHHQPLPASFRRLVNSLEANSTTPVTDVARVVVRGRPNPTADDPEGSSFIHARAFWRVDGGGPRGHLPELVHGSQRPARRNHCNSTHRRAPAPHHPHLRRN